MMLNNFRWLASSAFIGLFFISAVAFAAPGDVITTHTGAKMVKYRGSIIDEAGKPVSGIYPMTFKLYSGVRSKKPVWSDSLWVAVDKGSFVLTLGDDKPLPKSDLSTLVLAVEIRGAGEIVREPFVLDPTPTAVAAKPAAGKDPAGASVRYADTAGYAVEADHAKNADRIGNMTLEEVSRRIATEAGAGGGKSKVGASKKAGASVGGPGGTTAYEDSCPKGWVVTGIRGMHGNVIDSIQLVCSPIE